MKRLALKKVPGTPNYLPVSVLTATDAAAIPNAAVTNDAVP
jgi:hypothetical protein